MPTAYYKSDNHDFTLLKGDCIELLNSFDFKFDMIFADPPYHLSNVGISVQSGKMVSVNKGDWDKSNGYEEDYLFDKSWIAACRNKLKSNEINDISKRRIYMDKLQLPLPEDNHVDEPCVPYVQDLPF